MREIVKKGHHGRCYNQKHTHTHTHQNSEKKSDIEALPVSSIPAANPFDGSKMKMYYWSTGRNGQWRFLAAGTAASRNLNGILLRSFVSLCQLSSDLVLVGRPVGRC